MSHPLRTVVLLASLVLGFTYGSAAGAEEKKAEVVVKGCTAEISSCTCEAKENQSECKECNCKDCKECKCEKCACKECAKKNPSPTQTGNSTKNEVGDVKVYNYGIQAVFINSNVTVNGGTISGEMTKNENAAASPAAPEAKPEPKPAEEASGQPAGGQKEEKPSKFDELIKDATKEVGLFTIYTRKDGKIYWEVPPDQFNKNFLISGIMATGLGAGWVKPGAYLGGIVVQFAKIDDKIQLMQRNLRFVAENGSTEEKALEKNYKDSIVAAFPVEATNPANAANMIEFSKFLLSDTFSLNQEVNSSLGGGYGFDPGNSYVKETKVFPENMVIRVVNAYRSMGGRDSLSVPTPGSAQLEILLDVRNLKDNPKFKPRQADPRLGHFLEAQMNFSDKERSSLFIRNISRWDVRKASPELDLSPPEKPIVVWIENTVPKKYRDAVRNGLLEWNKAFEKIGVKDALVVKEQPDDAAWDISDARYNTIHWNESYESAYSGVAQWVADPRTGEILHGSFLIEAETIRGLINMQRYLEPDRVQMVKNNLNPVAPKFSGRLFNNDPQESVDQAALGLTILAAREAIADATCESSSACISCATDIASATGVQSASSTACAACVGCASNAKSAPCAKKDVCLSSSASDEFINQFLFWVICHEFGHVLGLRHNFEASTMLPLEELNNKELTKQIGMTASIMEYQPPNIAPEGVRQGYYYSPAIGPYDYLAIEYAYKEIKPATGETESALLDQIAEKAETSTKYTYGTDEDLYGGSPYYGSGIDPLCNQFDLGSDPLAFAKQRTQVILDTIPKLPKLVKEGDTYLAVRNAFNRLMGYYFDNARFAVKYIGGQYVNRTKKSANRTRQPLEPVSAARQREALNFILETLFSDQLFQVDSELLNMMAAEKWLHWGTDFPGAASEYPLSAVAQELYDGLLGALYSPSVIHRILDAEKQRPSGEVNFTIPELFRRMKQGVWNEEYREAAKEAASTFTSKNPFVSTYRRILQRQHLKLTIEMMLEPGSGIPDDARIQAWRTLVDLEKQLDKVAKKYETNDQMDEYSRDHLIESLQKIRRALDARVSARVDLW